MSSIAAAVVGSAVVGAYASNKASKAAGKSADKIAATGDEANRLARDQFDWFKSEYGSTKGQRDATTALDNQVAGAQLEGMQAANEQAKELAARNKTVFQPLEDGIFADASNFDTEGRRQQAAAEATAGVEGAFGRAQDDLSRTLARNGVTPGGGRSQSLMQDAALKKATAIAGATTGAVKGVEQQGYARKMDAVGLGKGIVGNQATMQQIAQSGGAQAVAASGAANGAAMSGAGLMQTGFSGAQSGLQNAGALYGQAAKVQSYADKAKMDGLGMLSQAAGFLLPSDKNIKKGTGKPVNTKKALKGIEKTPVESGWKYDPSKGGPDDGGAPHDGPMAQQVRKHMGAKVAPGGKAIDLASMNGQLMAGMQELASRMTKLEKRVAA